MTEILHEEVLYQQGCFKRVRRWIRGKHPKLGKLTLGWTGWETIVETTVVMSMGKYYVEV